MRRRLAIKLMIPVLLGGCLAVTAYAAGRSADRPGPARFISSYILKASPDWFGGFSSISLGSGGKEIIMLTDRSHMLTGQIARKDGKLDDVQFETHTLLRNANGKSMAVWRDSIDSEGLAVGKNGELFISFEGQARVSRYVTPDSKAEDLPRPIAFKKLRENKALEGLAIDENGYLYTLPESSPGAEHPVWKWDGHAWQHPFSVPKQKGYLAVGLDIGPDGRFYLLERKFVLIGFQSRLRRWDFSTAGLSNETLLLTTSIGTHANLEGLSVWRENDGSLRATMVSDDNFMPYQRSELVEYHLPD